MPRTADCPVTCEACGAEMTVTLTATLTGRRWELLAADPDLVMARLFVAAHRGPFRLAGQPA